MYLPAFDSSHHGQLEFRPEGKEKGRMKYKAKSFGD